MNVVLRPAIFQSTPPAWGATYLGRSKSHHRRISIHAPRMGSEKHFLHACAVVAHISIHAPPHGERPPRLLVPFQHKIISIHAPAWGATSIFRLWLWNCLFQSTLPHGERPLCRRLWAYTSGYFNPRSPHGERPPPIRAKMTTSHIFQSTPPAWGAT